MIMMRDDDDDDNDKDNDDHHLLLGDKVDPLIDLAKAASSNLSRHFPSLLIIIIIIMTMMILMMISMIETLTMCPGWRRSSLDWWLVIFKQKLKDLFVLLLLFGSSSNSS